MDMNANSYILLSFCWSAALVAALIFAGRLYPVTSEGLIFGILVWVAVLVDVMRRIGGRMQREVPRIRTERENASSPEAGS